MIRHIRALAALVALSLSTVACVAPTEQDEQGVEVEETSQEVSSRSAYFETFESVDGRYYFHLIAGNGENVLRSQGYTRLASAQNGVASVIANGLSASNFDVRQAKNGEWYFNLKAPNGQIIATSELYVTKSNATRGASTVRRLVGVARAGWQDAPRREAFELFKGEDGKSYFRLRAGNGEIMLASQGYTTAASARKGIASVRENGSAVDAFQVFEAYDGGWGIRLVARNGEIIARGETYSTKSNANRAVRRLAEIIGGGSVQVADAQTE
ncbi:MAG: DUF1508 domain-containing protein [Labilithrix sp.]|nr:DUF1508 domain-containing protein [Labilithrix sp.]